MNNNNKIDTLTKLAINNNLHHALLLYGHDRDLLDKYSNSLAKLQLCRNIDKDISCDNCVSCELFSAKTHPDLLCIGLEDKSNSIKVDNIRVIHDFIASTPKISNIKVVIILNADKLNLQASNALLKTIEEPFGNTSILMLSNSINELPKTIVSRCLKVNIKSPKFLEEAVQADVISDLVGLIIDKDVSVVDLAEKWDKHENAQELLDILYSLFATVIGTNLEYSYSNQVEVNQDYIKKIIDAISSEKLFLAQSNIIAFKRNTKFGNNPNFQLFLIDMFNKILN